MPFFDEETGREYRVVSVTPAGRRKYGPCLVPYIERARPLIDEHHWWINTEVPQDVAFCRQLISKIPNFHRCISPHVPPNGVRTIHHFFPMASDPDTIYIRFDDDIVWVAPDAVAELVRFRLKHKRAFLVYANTINNTLCSHIHERFGAFQPSGHCGYDICCPHGHNSWKIAEEAHRALIQAVRDGETDRYKFPAWWLYSYEFPHVNCVSWFGEDILRHGPVPEDEECWLGHLAPVKTQRPNVICGTALVSHFSYHSQHNDQILSGILNEYRSLVE